MEGNVSDIAKKRKHRNKQRFEGIVDDDKPNRVDLYHEMMHIINENDLKAIPNNFPNKYFVCTEEDGSRSILIGVKNRPFEVAYTDIKSLENDILAFAHEIKTKYPAYKWKHADARETAIQWRAITKPIPRPSYVSFQGDQKISFRHIDWDIEEDGQTPIIDEILNRCATAEALQLFIGSLFFEDSYKQQYLWLYGEGGQGKGTLAGLVKWAFNKSAKYCTVPKSPQDYKFFNSNLLGRRVLIFDDCPANDFLKSPALKTITGSDYVDIEVKYGDKFEYKHNAKFIFTSNEMPFVSGDSADTRRIIPCFVESRGTTEVDPTFNDRIYANEAKFFISRCIRMFRDKQALKAPIEFDMAVLEESIEDHDEWAMALFEKHCTLNPDYAIPSMDFFNYFREQLRIRSPRDQRVVELKKIWARRLGVEFGVVVKKGGKAIKCCRGFSIKHFSGYPMPE